MASKVLGLLDLHNCPELGPLTTARSLASTSFLGRFAFMDFALSNFSNSGIDEVGILVKAHLRSVLKHMGSMQSWNINTKIGRETIMYNERGNMNRKKNTDINNILVNDWVLHESKAKYIIIQPAHVVCKIDFEPILKEHVKRGEKVSLIYKRINDAHKAFATHNIVNVKNGYVRSFKNNRQKEKEALVSMETYIINRDVLTTLIEEALKFNPTYTIKDAIKKFANKLFKVRAFEHFGYARSFDSLEHFVDYSFELLDYRYAHQLFQNDWPIYTITRDTTPTLYGTKANIRDSFIANGAIVEGRVEHSIISRNVKVGRGAIIRNSIILADTAIGENAVINHAVIDKYCHVSDGVHIDGTKTNPKYIEQGKKL
ncbi:MAG: glucose-1-phosphate adenylyltransferase subunit GlgD [Bacilli bacterium]|jgi:glucose-1-phosphate adenylyltransferase|nr:glucose-1-phosphate adenylyltransferase subunit GlgD [Bacilli bacterium]MDD4006220.1 glucose-1-phosphate adenylyltransferase subunit GlgD [Bacilli bacterium]